MKKFIITGANGDIAISMAKIIRKNFKNIKIIGTDIKNKWPGLYYFDDFFIIPEAKNMDYMKSLKKLVKKNSRCLIIPTSEPEIRYISKNIDFFKDIPLLINDSEISNIFLDKYKTFKWLMKNNIESVKTFKLNEKNIKFPIIVKPRYGSGSRNIFKISNKKELNFFKKYIKEDLIAQNYLHESNQEYTCAIYKNKFVNKNLIMKRKMKNDITSEMFITNNLKIEKILNLISNNIDSDLFINVQLRLSKKRPMIFEINPRFSSTVRMRDMFGFQDLVWAIKDHFNIRQEIKNIKIIKNSKIYKVYEEIVEK